jgi:hypothetical protein
MKDQTVLRIESLSGRLVLEQESDRAIRIVIVPDREPNRKPDPVPESGGLWISPSTLRALPTSGAAWDQVSKAAKSNWGSALLSNQDSKHNVLTLAGSLVAMRQNDSTLRHKVVDAIMSAIGTETKDPGDQRPPRTLALGRNLVAYIIAADLINLKELDSSKDSRFRTWLTEVRKKTLDDMTLISTHEKRPNNWGTHAGASRIAAALYLGDKADLDRAATVFKGWLGDRAAYADFKYGDLFWQADPSKPVGINPKNAVKNGCNLDGALPEELRRVGSFTWPPPKENYCWEALQGALVQAELLHHAGYPAWEWEDRALLRAVTWLHEQCHYSAEGDDTWQVYLINARYSTKFPVKMPAQAGKNMGFTDWTHAR